jgi:BirA family biotin operon repressor/biotin-[acetyl-CoA-carboxylase] ligase
LNKKQSDSLVRLVSILSDREFHDGDSLGKILGMTRSAVWKAIHKLQTYGMKIDSLKGKGYALLEPLILLEAKKIEAYLQRDTVRIDVFETIDSTNNYLKKMKSSSQIQVCLAEQQTLGRGRLQREWYSPFGRNIYLSFLYPFHKDISELAGLSLVVSLAVLTTLKKYVADPAMVVKWPNDLIFDGMKLSGSLIEIQAETHDMCHAIIGIGINANMLQDAGAISQHWTSLQKITGEYVDRNVLSAELLKILFNFLKKFEQFGFVEFVTEWAQADFLTGRFIELDSANKRVQGKVLGVNEQGHLLLQTAEGDLRAFSSGDTTLIKKG